MCLGVPGKIIDINGSMATVDFWGVRRQVNLDIVDEPVQPGDYILNHVGFAIRRIPEESIAETLALYEILMKEAEEDAMAADVRGEIEGTERRRPDGWPGAVPAPRRDAAEPAGEDAGAPEGVE
ncbi:MAG TPA: HypC/HybG/HupF family hydrogenase formation chaperone [Thermoanaerobaculia bacterium]|nr:HypC/HybG/HupF family hydrogenase formation chaperone [Thermoanaerobaculia bacterium]